MRLAVEVPYLTDVGADSFHGAEREPLVRVVCPLGFSVFDATEIFPCDAVLNEESLTRQPFH